MAFNERLANRVRDYFSLHHIQFVEKRMMGGLCLLVDDKMCVGITEDRLMVRLDPDEYELALKRPGCAPMDFTGRPLKGFVFVTSEGLRTKRNLSYWLHKALEYNPKARSSKKTSRK